VKVTVPVVPDEECAACSTGRSARAREVVDGIDVVLCLDALTCAANYRGGVTPATYGAGLRGELLAVAP
jgi:hypothetical protein